MREHRKACIDCHHAARDPYAYCDQGWEMAKRESRAKYRLYKFAEGETEGQQALF